MKTKKSITIFAASAAVIFALLYIILGAIPLSKEYNYIPEWNLDLTTPVMESIPDEAQMIPFKLGQTVGYFTEEGGIALIKTFPQKASISESYFTTYNSDASQTDFFSCYGNKVGTIMDAGFPYLVNNRIYLMLPGGTSFSRCNQDGSIKWTNESVIPITAFSSNESFTIAGYADGDIRIVNNIDGSNVLTFNPGGSDYSVILGVDISPDGKYIASISGHNAQRFIITERAGDQSKILYHETLEHELNHRTLVKFSNDGSKIFYNYSGGFGIYDLGLKKDIKIPLTDRILNIEESNNLLFLLGKTDKTYTVYIIEKTNAFLGKFDFEADSAFIKTYNEFLYVGRDTNISKMSIQKK
ncbi:MAG: WD40 repeat domain-containing protein [Treponema sp.]|nr:WD40 repeat domain-containing protein [Treponema sp.]